MEHPLKQILFLREDKKTSQYILPNEVFNFFIITPSKNLFTISLL